MKAKKNRYPNAKIALGVRVPESVRDAMVTYCREYNGKSENLGASISPSSLGKAIIIDWLKRQGVQDI